MNRKKELREAIEAARQVLKATDYAINILNKANKWSFLDILGGEGLSSFMKRNHIRSANRAINELKYDIERLRKELGDINIDLPGEISDSLSDNMFDIFFDNIFTDLRVRSEIKGKINELIEFRDMVQSLIQRLEREI
ncbi:hypothetical protein [Anaerococcus marasmi]|uniref:hypothetical protein n=1 Tax=Anaerococcus marasmi TaxID=2057797 RepID=UPI000CF84DEA|nr:hypothetical protein [Anaerococcus marasmi]